MNTAAVTLYVRTHGKIAIKRNYMNKKVSKRNGNKLQNVMQSSHEKMWKLSSVLFDFNVKITLRDFVIGLIK